MRLLVVEDEPALRTMLAEALREASYVVDTAADGEDGAHLGAHESYDAIILDLGLPVMDGLSVLAEWRSAAIETPVLVLTARGGWRDKVQGLRTGADDYLAKPFETEELLARVEALIRRSRGQTTPVVSLGCAEIDMSRRTVSRAGKAVALSPTEYRAFAYLALNRGRVISKSEMTEHLYDQDFDLDSNVIEVLVARLRKKLGADLVKTQRGHGYYVD
ncbi:MAG: response regulator transcription factor [Pseudomonadota bacterium]